MGGGAKISNTESLRCQTFTDLVKAIILGKAMQETGEFKNHYRTASQSSESSIDPRREDVLTYIDRIRNLMTDNWKADYRKWWGEIIDSEMVSAEIYRKGLQKNTTFNRNLVGNIINYLGHHGMIKMWNASNITQALENTVEHSMREALRKDPPDDILEVLKSYTK